MITPPASPVQAPEDRFELLRTYLREIAAAPLLGHGSGYSHSLLKNPHNRYLYEWVNLGLPGLLAYLALVAGGMYLFWSRRDAGGVFLMAMIAGYSMLSHGLMESRGLLLGLGMAATLSIPGFRESGEVSDAARSSAWSRARRERHGGRLSPAGSGPPSAPST